MALPPLPDFVPLIYKRLKGSGHQAYGYVEGGALRDTCLGRQVTDWDVATSATNVAIETIFHERRYFALKGAFLSDASRFVRYFDTPVKCPQLPSPGGRGLRGI